jgi:hypothetical protein
LLTLGLRATVLGAPGLVLRFTPLTTLGAAGLSAAAGKDFRFRGASDISTAGLDAGAATGVLPNTLRQSILPIAANWAIPATFETTQ